MESPTVMHGEPYCHDMESPTVMHLNIYGTCPSSPPPPPPDIGTCPKSVHSHEPENFLVPILPAPRPVLWPQTEQITPWGGTHEGVEAVARAALQPQAEQTAPWGGTHEGVEAGSPSSAVAVAPMRPPQQ